MLQSGTQAGLFLLAVLSLRTDAAFMLSSEFPAGQLVRSPAGCFSAGRSPVTNWASPIRLPEQPAVDAAGTESRVDLSHSFEKKE